MKLKRTFFLGKLPSPAPGFPFTVKQVHEVLNFSLPLPIKWEYKDQPVSSSSQNATP